MIRRVRATSLGALAIRTSPFEAVVEALRAIGPLSRPRWPSQIVAASDSCDRWPVRGRSLASLEEVDRGICYLVTITTFDVTFMLRDTTKGLGGHGEYKPHLFGDEAIDRLLAGFQQVLGADGFAARAADLSDGHVSERGNQVSTSVLTEL